MKDISEECMYNLERKLYKIIQNYRNNSGDEIYIYLKKSRE